jgi:hypothetical protein
MTFQYYDNLEAGDRSCYVGDVCMWRIPFYNLEEDEPPFGTYAPTTTNRITVIHEDEDEPPFIETNGYDIIGPSQVREIGAEFQDWPANKEDPKVTMRLVEWGNGEGFDVAFNGGLHTDVAMFSLTWTRFDMLTKLVGLLREE